MSKLLQALVALEARECNAAGRVVCMLNSQQKLSHLNAFVAVCGDRAVQQAHTIDKKSASRSKPMRPLEGLVVAVKDNIATAGVRTTAGSKMLENFVPQYDATAIKHLSAAGAIMIGKTNMDEFGMGSSTTSTPYGATINPLSKHTIPLTAGGSSGGSAATVAAGLCDFAIGSDTGGSVRQPAAYCGVVGLKPTYGRISRHGLIAYASSMDTIGVITPTVTDAALVFDNIAGPDEKDPTSIQIPLQPTIQLLYPSAHGVDTPQSLLSRLGASQNLKGMRIGLPKELHPAGIADPVLHAWDTAARALRDAGAEIVHVSIPTIPHALACYYVLACAQASSNLARYDGVRYGFRGAQPTTSTDASALQRWYMATRSQGFGDEVIRRIITGTFVLSESASHEYFDQATRVAEQLRSEFQACFADVSAILSPTTPLLPFHLFEQPDATQMLLNDIMTVLANLTGVPAISLPVESTTQSYASKDNATTTLQLPVSVQVMAPWLGEGTMLQVARAIEERVCYQSDIASLKR